MRSELAVPLFSSDGRVVVGVLNVESRRPGLFTSKHQELLIALARRAQLAVQRANLFEALQTLARKVLEMDQNALLEYTVEALADLLHVPVCSVWLVDRTTGDLKLKQAIGRPEILAEARGTQLSPEELQRSFHGSALHSSEPLSLADVRQAPEFLYRDLAKERGWVSALAVSIRDASDQPLGVTSVYSVGEERDFTGHDRSVAITFSNQVATALQQASFLMEKEQAAKHLQVINQLLSASVSVSDVDEILRRAVLELYQVFGYRADICVLEQQQLVFKATGLYDGTVKQDALISPYHKGITGRVVSSGHPQIVPDVHQDPDYYYVSAPETASELAVPLINGQERVIGVLNIESKERDAFTLDHLHIFKPIAAGITLALENARHHQERKALRRISTIVCQAQDLNEILDATVTTALDLFVANACSLYLVEPDGQHLTRVRHKGLPHALEERARRLQRGESIAGKVLQYKEPLVVWDVVTDPRADNKVTAEDNLRSAMAVPIKTDEGILGVLMVSTANTRYFTQHETEMLDEIGGHIGLAIEKDRAHHQYRRLYQDARDPMFTVDLEGYIVDANETASRMSGYEPDELRGMPLTALIADDNVAAQVPERLSRVGRGEEVPHLEFAMRHKDQSTLFFESNLTPIRNHFGTVTAIQAIWRDVTPRRQAAVVMRHRNQLLKTLLEITQNVIRSYAHGDLLAWVTEGTADLLESDRCAVYLCEDHTTLVEAYAFPSLPWPSWGGSPVFPLGEGLIGQVARSGQGQMVNNFPQQEALPHAPPGYTLEDKEYLELVANLLTLDLAYRRLAETQAKQQTAVTVLEQMDLVGGFLAHKVCGFLGAVGATADLLHSCIQSTDQVTASLMNNLRMHGRTADRLVAQFRSMRKTANQQTEVVSLQEVIETALQQVSIPSYIRLDCGPLDLPAVRANRDLLIEVFEGVFRNALDSMPNVGTLSIWGGTNHDQSESWLYIRDTGPGMPLKVRENLFKPFFSTKIDDGGGLGLGLWLSRLYLQTLGGDIDVTHTSPEGSTFAMQLPTVRETHAFSDLPLRRGELEHKAQREEKAQREQRAIVQSETPCVLVVEDESYWQGVLSPLLMLHGLQVQIATQAQEAFALLNQQTFAAFIVDVRLVAYDAENMEGLDIVRHVRTQTQHRSAPVLILSVWEPALTIARERFGKCKTIQIVDKMDRQGLKAALNTFAQCLTHSQEHN